MCTTSVSVAEINQRLDAPAAFYSAPSPSSIAEMELGEREHAQPTEACDKIESKAGEASVPHERESSLRATTASAVGDDSLRVDVAGRQDACSAGRGDINADVSTAALSTSSTPRKRRWSDVAEGEDHVSSSSANPSKRVQLGDGQDVKPVSPDSQEDQVRSGSESVTGSSWEQAAETADGYDDDVCYSPAVDLDCSEQRYSRRTLYIEYWSRTDECKERKWDHLDEIADKYGSAEEHIFATTLNGRTACLEPNMFPYNTPEGIEHWTLWHVQDLNHEQIKQYVENWIDANAPHVHRWNYDDNPERSIDIFHVHVYLQVSDGDSVLQGRKVEDLMHECD